MASIKSRKRLLRWIGGGLMLLLLLQIFISVILAPILESRLKLLVTERSEGLYQLERVEIDWEFFNRKLMISDVRLSIDTTQQELLSTLVEEGKSFVRIEIPQMQMEWWDLVEILDSKELRLRTVEVFSPTVSVSSHRKERKKRNRSGPDQGLWGKDWYEQISPIMSGIYVDHLRIGGGTFRLNDGNFFSKNSFVAEQIEIVIEDFQLDSTVVPDPDRPFFAANISIEVGVNNYSYILPDSSYNIEVGKIGISTSEQLIFAEDVQLLPNFRQYQKRLAQGKQPGNLLEMHLPKIDMLGFQVNEVYDHRTLNLDMIRFHSPYLVQIGKVQTDSVPQEELEARQLYQRIAPYLRSIQVDQLLVDGGRVQRIFEPGDTLRSLDLQGLDLVLEEVRLDSALLKPNRRLLFSDQIALAVDRYSVRLSDNNYQLSGEQLSLSTQSQQLRSQEIHLAPTSEVLQLAQIQGQDVIDLTIPEAEIQGINLPQIWYDRQVAVDQILIQSPDVRLLNYPEVRKEQVDSLAQADLYELISDYLVSVAVKEVSVMDGNFTLNTQPEPLQHEFSASDIRVTIQNFQLNDSARQVASTPFYADDLDVNVNISGYSFELPDSSYVIQANHIGISAGDSAIFADSVWIIPNQLDSVDLIGKNRHRTKVFVPHIRFSGLDVNEAYFDRVLELDSLWLDHPLVLVNSQIQQRKEMIFTDLEEIDLYPAIEGQLRALRVKTLQIDTASFSYERVRGDTLPPLNLPAITVSIYNFSLDSTTQIGPDNMLYSDDIQLHLADVSFPLTDSVHQIDANQLTLSTKDRTIRLTDLSLRPQAEEVVLEQLKAPNLYEIQVPSLRIDGVDAYELYQEQRLLVDEVHIDAPIVSLTNYPEVDKAQIDSLARSDLYGLISRQLNELNIGNFWIVGGQFDLNETETTSPNAFSAKGILLHITNFRLDSTAQERTNNPFYADNIDMSMDVENYSFQLPDSSYEIQVDSIAFSTNDSSISARNIYLIPKLAGTPQRPVAHSFEIFAPKMVLSGINAEALYFNRLGNFNSLKIDRPQIVATQHELAESKPPFDLYQKIAPLLDQLTIREISVSHGSFRQRLLDETSDSPMNTDDVSVQLRGFELDSLGWMQPEKVLYARDARVQLHDFVLPFQDSLYSFQAGEIGISTQERRFYLDSVQVYTNYTARGFKSRLGYGKDQMLLQVPHIEGQSLNLYRYWTSSRLDIRSLELSQLGILIEKNRDYDPNPDKQPPLLQDLLKDIPLVMAIDTISILDGHLDFYEKPKDSDLKGHFYLNEMRAKILGLTNDSLLLITRKRPQLILQAQAKLMGESPLRTTFVYALRDSNRSYTYKGNVGKLSLDVLNTILEPSASLTVRSGLMDSLRFEGQANARRSKGKMWMAYSDLNVALIQNESMLQDSVVKRKWMVSAIANTLVLKSRNPRRRYLRVGRIRYDIDPSKIFFAHWVNALLSGAKSSIGLETEEEKDKTLGIRFRRKQANRAK